MSVETNPVETSPVEISLGVGDYGQSGPVAVGVVVIADPENFPAGVLGSLDAQTLPAEQFEITVVDRGLSAEQRQSLDRLAARRTNLVVVPDSDVAGAPDGTFVLRVGADYSLFPEALSRLVAFAEEHGLDGVVGRIVQLGAPVPAFCLRDAPDLDAAARAEALAGPVTLARRASVQGVGYDVELDDDTRIGVLASYPAAYLPTRAGVPGLVVYADRPRLSWEGAEIRIEATGTVADEPGDDVRPVLLARQLDTFLTYVLPGEGSLDPRGFDDRVSSWRVAASFAPLTLAGGPLPTGQWQIDVVLTGRRASAPVRLPGADLGIGLLDGLAVVTAAEPRNTLHLDVGATRHGLVANAAVAEATVTESAAGSLLRVRLPEVHVQTSQPVTGQLGLDRLRVPATIETGSGTAELTAYVSGLAGTYAISTQFGAPPLRPTGLSLQVLGDGEMTVIATPAEPRPAVARPNRADAINSAGMQGAPAKKVRATKKAGPAKKAGPGRKAGPGGKKAGPSKKTAAGPSAGKKPGPGAKKTAPGKKKAGAATKKRTPPPVASGPVARLRHAVPPSWEPQMKRLRRQPVLRALYQQLTGLPDTSAGGRRAK